MLIDPLPQQRDLRQQPQHQLNRRLTTRPRDPLRIRNPHKRKTPCAVKESSRSPRPHVNAYLELVETVGEAGKEPFEVVGELEVGGGVVELGTDRIRQLVPAKSFRGYLGLGVSLPTN